MAPPVLLLKMLPASPAAVTKAAAPASDRRERAFPAASPTVPAAAAPKTPSRLAFLDRPPSPVAKARVEQLILLKRLDGKTPVQRAAILDSARRRRPSAVRADLPLDGKTPVERADILARRRAAR